MKVRTDYEAFRLSSEANRRLLCQEELILEVTELLAQLLRRERITKTQLAARLGKSKPFVSQILAGGRNLTLRTLADVADALRCRVKVQACPERDTLPLTTLDEMTWTAEGARAPWSGKVVIGTFGQAKREGWAA